MTYQEARLRLANHAGLPSEELPEAESFTWALWNATRTRTPPESESLATDVINCLQVINRELNGPTPSETTERSSESGFMEVAYSVSGIVSNGLRYIRQWSRESLFGIDNRAALTDAVYRIAYGWDQVLAGDIDDILEGVEL